MLPETTRYEKLLDVADVIDGRIRRVLEEASMDHRLFECNELSEESYESRMRSLPDVERLQARRDTFRFNAGEPYLSVPETYPGQEAPDIEMRIASLRQRQTTEYGIAIEEKRFADLTRRRGGRSPTNAGQ